MPYTLLNLVVGLAIAGLILWAINQIPMDATITKIIRVVVIVVVCIWLLYFLTALIPNFSLLPPPRRL